MINCSVYPGIKSALIVSYALKKSGFLKEKAGNLLLLLSMVMIIIRII